MATVPVEQLYLQHIASFSLNNPSAAFQFPRDTEVNFLTAETNINEDRMKQLVVYKMYRAGIIMIWARPFSWVHLVLQSTAQMLWIGIPGTATLFWRVQVGTEVILQLEFKPLLC